MKAKLESLREKLQEDLRVFLESSLGELPDGIMDEVCDIVVANVNSTIREIEDESPQTT